MTTGYCCSPLHQGHCGWLCQYWLLVYREPEESFTMSVVGLRSCDTILGDSATPCSCYVQCLGREWIIILGFPPVVCPSSNWAGCLCCSHGWHSSDWRTQLLQLYSLTALTHSLRFAGMIRRWRKQNKNIQLCNLFPSNMSWIAQWPFVCLISFFHVFTFFIK